MIFDTTYDLFNTPEPVRTALRKAVRDINAGTYTKAERLLQEQLDEAVARAPDSTSADYVVISIYLAIAVARGKGHNEGVRVIRNALDHIGSIDREEAYQRPRLTGVLLWLLEDNNETEQALRVAEEAVRQFVGTSTDDDGDSNLYIEDVHLTYATLLLKQGRTGQALDVLNRVVARSEASFRKYGPAFWASEEGKFERFQLHAIVRHAKKLIAESSAD